MDSSFWERLGRLERIQGIGRVSSGSPAVFVLTRAEAPKIPLTIDAMRALTRRGLRLRWAAQAIDAVLDHGRVSVEVPVVESTDALIADLATAGFAAELVPVVPSTIVRELRERLGLTCEQFAARYGLEPAAVRSWESGEREPDTTARSYLRAIANDPAGVEAAYAGELGVPLSPKSHQIPA